MDALAGKEDQIQDIIRRNKKDIIMRLYDSGDVIKVIGIERIVRDYEWDIRPILLDIRLERQLKNLDP